MAQISWLNGRQICNQACKMKQFKHNMEDTNKKINNILKLSPIERYKYFIRKISDFEEVWGLYNDGWAMTKSNDKVNSIIFWPEKIFAEKCINDEWKNYIPKAITLDTFIEKWLPGMNSDGLDVAIFYTLENKGIIIKPLDLRDDIKAELDQYD